LREIALMEVTILEIKWKKEDRLNLKASLKLEENFKEHHLIIMTLNKGVEPQNERK